MKVDTFEIHYTKHKIDKKLHKKIKKTCVDSDSESKSDDDRYLCLW